MSREAVLCIIGRDAASSASQTFGVMAEKPLIDSETLREYTSTYTPRFCPSRFDFHNIKTATVRIPMLQANTIHNCLKFIDFRKF